MNGNIFKDIFVGNKSLLKLKLVFDLLLIEVKVCSQKRESISI